MDQGIEGARDLLQFQVNRNIVNLYKSFLVLTEDLHYENQAAFDKLKRVFPEDVEVIDQANCIDEGRLEYLRKKVLDAGNNCARQTLGDMDNYSINLNI
jgi:hypothetical protein|tara:strand:+ start:12997 stop:13293 length:297 start_codon:yes stop_codon:yes gene_type:complete